MDAANKMGAAHVELMRNMYDVPNQLAATLKEGDMVLILGAGNINQIAPALLEYLKTNKGSDMP